MEITESLTDISLPYFVYRINEINAIIPIARKIHANTHNVKEGSAKESICSIKNII